MGHRTPRDQRRDDRAQQHFRHSRKYARVNRVPAPSVTTARRRTTSMNQQSPILSGHTALTRRGFLSWTTRRGISLAVAAGAVPALLAACGNGDDNVVTAPPGTAAPGASAPPTQAAGEARAIIDDVVDFRADLRRVGGRLRLRDAAAAQGRRGRQRRLLHPDRCVRCRIRAGARPGLRPKLKVLAQDGLAGTAVLSDDDEQPVVLSSEPGRKDYTPAWRVQRARWVKDRTPAGIARRSRGGGAGRRVDAGEHRHRHQRRAGEVVGR